jgi:outer membrane protein
MAGRVRSAAGPLATLLLMLTGAAHGDTLFGIYAGAGSWQQNHSGDVASGNQDVDVERDLDLDDENNNVLYLALEHGIPVLPNVRLNYTEVSTSGFNALTRTVTFQGEVFTVSEDVRSELDLEQADAVLYYELLDNIVSLDLGIAARWVDGVVEVASDSSVGRAEFKGVLPMVYGRARADLPLTGLWVGAEAMGLAYDGHRLLDAAAQVGWESPIGLGAEIGWRAFNLELDSFDDIDSAEIDISGPYAAVNFHF